ncbi:hypothetical protein AB0B07_12900 [Streptomyces sioyaensis]|uniref:hypothetical protein n=1 Tax=Streptomyces TaxID=1883 RepID=UPI00089D1EE4|nr:hypothetical protein [Streptomyces sp. 2314.4]SEC28146.1 hypothetical protein SAMN05428943_1368 [Streptomyces sp. 2314.4]
MKPAHTAAAALLGVAVLGLAAPAASAHVEPDPMVAGQRVRISDGSRCAPATGARVASPLFGSVVLRPGHRGMAADVQVAEGTAPGRYPVTVECGPGRERFTETVTVRDGRVEGVDAGQAVGGLALFALAGGAAYWLRRTANGRSPGAG